jgi:hypothetical protein
LHKIKDLSLSPLIINMSMFLAQKRLARKDMHTVYDAAFARLESLSDKELMDILKDKDVSDELAAKAKWILWKRLDPQDRDTVEV